MKYVSFVEPTEAVDPATHMQLQDLARALTHETDLSLRFDIHSAYDWERTSLTVSTFWNPFPAQAKQAGQKSDVYLRCIGSAHYTNAASVRQYLADAIRFPKFSRQLFGICEDARLARICISLRPGTDQALAWRRRLLEPYFQERAQVHFHRQEFADLTLLWIYAYLNPARETTWLPALPASLVSVTDAMASHLATIPTLPSTDDVADLCHLLVSRLVDFFAKDAVADYFPCSASNATPLPVEGRSFKDLLRVDKLKHQLQATAKENAEYHEDKISTWHRETQDDGGSSFRMNLEQGAAGNHQSDDWRTGADDNIPITSTAQGSARQMAERSSSTSPTPTRRLATEGDTTQGETASVPPTDASHRMVDVAIPSSEAELAYRSIVDEIRPLRDKLKRVVQKALDHKQQAARNHLFRGRLTKQVVQIALEEDLRAFYQKGSPTTPLDAVFLLLVDCSGSMYDRMEATRRGVALFHETLKSLRIPHAVMGFWEDTEGTSQSEALTLFQPVIEFDTSLQRRTGPQIMQLSAKLDNRDGYAIRAMSRRLLRRTERRKFLLVFSDGEPAASNYEQQGTFDTYQAVLEAHRRGIDVMNILFTREDEGQEAGVHAATIYGPGAISLSDVKTFPEEFGRILRRLLMNMM